MLPQFHRPGNIYYPGFKRNFWLEFTSPRSEAAPSPAPAPAPVAPRPHFLHPSTNGSVMTVTLGQTTRVDCEVADLAGYQVVNIVTDPSVLFCHVTTVSKKAFNWEDVRCLCRCRGCGGAGPR